MGFSSDMADFICDDAVTTSGRSHGRRGDAAAVSKVRFDDFLPSWCIRRAPAWDNRSTRGVRRENLSKSGALERIGIALTGIVSHRQTVNKGCSDIRKLQLRGV